jgi:pyridoxamine 5'-phosphate oxidase
MTAPDERRLDREALGPDPVQAVAAWLDEAWAGSGLAYPNAACLSTVDSGGHPSGRIVLLKGVDSRGFVFFTNYRSAKAHALDARPEAALTLYWEALGRQVRTRGSVEKVTPAESDAYFASRPRVSQLGAWASSQSEPLESRGALEARFSEAETRFAAGSVPRPPHWGGYLIRPLVVEFWQEAPYRLHDRIVYRREDEDGPWAVTRLHP